MECFNMWNKEPGKRSSEFKMVKMVGVQYCIISVCNFQSIKSPVELNGLLSKFFCYTTWLLYQLIRRDTGRLVNEAFTSNPIVSSKQ